MTSVLLADEINRAPAKVQSALLEAMQEGQITIGDETVSSPTTFWVLATQNPIEHEGTYPAPRSPARPVPDEAHGRLSRPRGRAVDARLARAWPAPGRSGEITTDVRPCSARTDVLGLRDRAAAVRVAPAIKEYVVDLVRATREPARYGLDLAPLLDLGASPRATIALIRAARSHALLAGRDYVTPHDVKSLARDILRHRILISSEAEAEGLTADEIIGRILDRIPIP